MTTLAAARDRLNTYLAEVVLKREDLDEIKLRHLENELCSAAVFEADLTRGPF